jgi:hypothetical protein
MNIGIYDGEKLETATLIFSWALACSARARSRIETLAKILVKFRITTVGRAEARPNETFFRSSSFFFSTIDLC